MNFYHKLILAILTLFFLVTTTFAQDGVDLSDKKVAGFELGSYRFSITDDVRRPNQTREQSLNNGSSLAYYFEYYVSNWFGFGLRIQGGGAQSSPYLLPDAEDAQQPDPKGKGKDKNEHESEESTPEGKIEATEAIYISAILVTFQLNLVTSDKKTTRWGIIGGTGNGTYEYEKKQKNLTTLEEQEEIHTSTGAVSIAATFIDFGGDKWGGRLTFGKIWTDFDDMTFDQGEPKSVDGSGSFLSIGFRKVF